MPEEHPDTEPSSTAGVSTPADSGVDASRAAVAVGSASGLPKPGHFLPGGAGDILTEGDRAKAARRRQSLDLGKARTVAGPVDPTLRKKARPLPTDPDTGPTFGAPPPAPMPGAPITPLAGTRRTGSSRPVGWHSPSSRTGAQFSAEAPPTTPPRRYSNAVIAGLSVLTLLLVTGGTFAGFKLIDSYDSVSSPMSRPTVRKSEAPIPVLPDPTVTVTATPVPDLVRLRQNKLYTVGKVPTVTCTEPSIKPTSQSSVLKYYNALLPCLNRAWQPLVTKAGYEFRAPKIVLQSKQSTKPCERPNKDVTGYYCDTSEALSIPWQSVVKNHKSDPQGARTWMMTSFASLYGHHVQELTHILPATLSRQGWAKTEAEKLEWNRRRQLQAICLASAFLGANKEPLGLTGSRLELWEYQMKNSGDDNEPKEPRTHGSRKSNWLWTSAAFKSANPASCNTYTASAKKVS